ncbi:unnamed protein product [Arctogadus glacialis]
MNEKKSERRQKAFVHRGSPEGWSLELTGGLSPELTGGLEELTGGLDPGAHRRFGGSLSSAASAEPLLHHSISARCSLTTKPCSPLTVVRSKSTYKEVLCGDPIERTYREVLNCALVWEDHMDDKVCESRHHFFKFQFQSRIVRHNQSQTASVMQHH